MNKCMVCQEECGSAKYCSIRHQLMHKEFMKWMVPEEPVRVRGYPIVWDPDVAGEGEDGE